MNNWSRNLLFLICMIIFSRVIHNFDRKIENIDTNTTCYVMTVPRIIKQAFEAMFIMGILLFCGFLFLYLKKIGGVTKGHLNFAIVFTLIGVLAFGAASRWKIVVQEDCLAVFNIFSRQTIHVSDISKVYVIKDKRLEIYVSDRKVKSIDSMATNYSAFCNTLERYGIVIEEKNIVGK